MTTNDITYEQNQKIQRALLKQRRKINANAVVIGATVSIFILLMI